MALAAVTERPLTGSCESAFADLEELIAFHLHGEAAVEGGHLHYWGAAGESYLLDDRMPPGFVEVKECARYPDQVVWASEGELAVLAWRRSYAVQAGKELECSSGRLELDIYLDEAAYHDRLDDLAGVGA